jgi:hypothetical protein
MIDALIVGRPHPRDSISQMPDVATLVAGPELSNHHAAHEDVRERAWGSGLVVAGGQGIRAGL